MMAAQETWSAGRTLYLSAKVEEQKTDTETREAVSMPAAPHFVLA